MQTLKSGSQEEINQSAESKIPEEHKGAHGRSTGSHTGPKSQTLHLSKKDPRGLPPTSHTRGTKLLFEVSRKLLGTPKPCLPAIKGSPLRHILASDEYPPTSRAWETHGDQSKLSKVIIIKCPSYQKYNLCSVKCFPWMTALLRAIKKNRWLELMRFALRV